MDTNNPLSIILDILEKELPAVIASLNLKMNDDEFFRMEWGEKIEKWSVLLKEKLEKDAVYIERLMENENIEELSKFQLDYPELRWLRCLDRNSGLFNRDGYWYYEKSAILQKNLDYATELNDFDLIDLLLQKDDNDEASCYVYSLAVFFTCESLNDLRILKALLADKRVDISSINYKANDIIEHIIICSNVKYLNILLNSGRTFGIEDLTIEDQKKKYTKYCQKCLELGKLDMLACIMAHVMAKEIINFINTGSSSF